jgi:hypothetical protein
MQQAKKKPKPFIQTVLPQGRRKRPKKSVEQAYEVYNTKEEEDDKFRQRRARGHHFVGET